ncbi:C39 family peptidase [Patescibacteria group bacterium]|nr:C39 family peptidase [Patescibacteria group bacterium]
MKKILIIALFCILLPIGTRAEIEQEIVNLPVPFVSEIPDGIWMNPWSNACEEASMVMVDQYYKGTEKISISASKKMMVPIFTYENKVFGTNSDSNSERTAIIIDAMMDFDTTIVRNPTLEQIKDELRAGRPVISLHHGQKLANPHHRWRAGGSYYHMMVIVGFDDNTGEFILNDTADHDSGLDYRYKYDIVMDTLHDFNHKTRKANEEPTVMFTYSKYIVKAKGNNRVYLVMNNTKHHIIKPSLFKKYGWKWSKLKTVDKKWLDDLTTGEPIVN